LHNRASDRDRSRYLPRLKFGVISRLAEKIETKAKAELAHRLVPADAINRSKSRVRF
jgi:hypothetical protein